MNSVQEMTKHEAFCYLWENIITDEKYVGYHAGTDTDGYIASSRDFLAAYNANPDDWCRHILAWGTSAEMEAFETGWLRAVDARGQSEYYNKWNNDTKYTKQGGSAGKEVLSGMLTKAGLQPGQNKAANKDYYVVYINDTLVSCNPDFVSKKESDRISKLVGQRVMLEVSWKNNYAYFKPSNVKEELDANN